MNKLNLFFTLCVFFAALAISCDETPGNDFSTDSPRAVSITVSPGTIDFVPADGVKDTVVTVTVTAIVENVPDGNPPRLAVFERTNRSLPIFETLLSPGTGVNEYESNFDLQLNTLQFLQFDVFVFAFGDLGNGNWVSSTIDVDGFPNAKPVILEANNVTEVTIPTDATVIPVRFAAKVTDPDGQSTIDRVSILFLNEDGSVLTPNPNRLFDDGAVQSGDLIQGDSVFTITFSINNTNTPNNRTALYFAIDNAGLSSDTVRTTFNLVGN